MASLPSKSIANLRDMFRSNNDKVPPDLRHALSLLNISSLNELEERILATNAFLEPWSVYRDTYLLVSNTFAEASTPITRDGILSFYTMFDEGLRRHDPRTQSPMSAFEIDKSSWGAAEHEKHLYVWLLQTFHVGKSINRFDIRYFELQNVCVVWKEVFIPIVEAVRADYSMKGRRHYGPLALFIEERCPSRLAFPEGNINIPSTARASPTPFRVVSKPAHVRVVSQTALTKQNYDEAEKELRKVFPQYGCKVERPPAKQQTHEWLELQRTRAAHRKGLPNEQVARYVPPQTPQIEQQDNKSPLDIETHGSHSKNTVDRSPIKRCADSIRKSLSNFHAGRTSKQPQSSPSPKRPKTPKWPKSPELPVIPYGMYSYVPKIPKEEPKHPLHGVTTQLYIPDRLSDQGSVHDHDDPFGQADQYSPVDHEPGEQPHIDTSPPLPATRLPRPTFMHHRRTEKIIRTEVHRPWPLMDDIQNQGAYPPVQGVHVWSPMDTMSAIPPPLRNSPIKHDEPIPELVPETKPSYSSLRQRIPAEKPSYSSPHQHVTEKKPSYSSPLQPSYESTGFKKDINFTDDSDDADLSSSSRSASGDQVLPKQRRPLPAPIRTPPPCVKQLRFAPDERYRYRRPITPEPAPYVPQQLPWPGFEDRVPAPTPTRSASGPAPPIPAKSPARAQGQQRSWSERVARYREFQAQAEFESHGMSRIVSKDNIRAALSNTTPESSLEDLRAQVPRTLPSRVISPPKMRAYNTNMFPKKEDR